MYLTAELAYKTDKKSIYNAYDRNDLSIIEHGGVWYIEQPWKISKQLQATVHKEMKRIFPNIRHISEVRA